MEKVITFPPTQEDTFWTMIRTGIKDNGKWIYSTNQKRYEEMKTSYQILSQLFDEKEIVCGLSQELRSIGEITFTCDEIGVPTDQMQEFVRAIALADNICIYGIKGNRLKCGLSFNDVLYFEKSRF